MLRARSASSRARCCRNRTNGFNRNSAAATISPATSCCCNATRACASASASTWRRTVYALWGRISGPFTCPSASSKPNAWFPVDSLVCQIVERLQSLRSQSAVAPGSFLLPRLRSRETLIRRVPRRSRCRGNYGPPRSSPESSYVCDGNVARRRHLPRNHGITRTRQPRHDSALPGNHAARFAARISSVAIPTPQRPHNRKRGYPHDNPFRLPGVDGRGLAGPERRAQSIHPGLWRLGREPLERPVARGPARRLAEGLRRRPRPRSATRDAQRHLDHGPAWPPLGAAAREGSRGGFRTYRRVGRRANRRVCGYGVVAVGDARLVHTLLSRAGRSGGATRW